MLQRICPEKVIPRASPKGSHLKKRKLFVANAPRNERKVDTLRITRRKGTHGRTKEDGRILILSF